MVYTGVDEAEEKHYSLVDDTEAQSIDRDDRSQIRRTLRQIERDTIEQITTQMRKM